MNTNELITRNFGDLPNLWLRTVADMNSDERRSYSYARLLRYLATSENPGSDVSQTDMAFGQRSLVPHSLTRTTGFSLKLLL